MLGYSFVVILYLDGRAASSSSLLSSSCHRLWLFFFLFFFTELITPALQQNFPDAVFSPPFFFLYFCPFPFSFLSLWWWDKAYWMMMMVFTLGHKAFRINSIYGSLVSLLVREKISAALVKSLGMSQISMSWCWMRLSLQILVLQMAKVQPPYQIQHSTWRPMVRSWNLGFLLSHLDGTRSPSSHQRWGAGIIISQPFAFGAEESSTMMVPTLKCNQILLVSCVPHARPRFLDNLMYWTMVCPWILTDSDCGEVSLFILPRINFNRYEVPVCR